MRKNIFKEQQILSFIKQPEQVCGSAFMPQGSFQRSHLAIKKSCPKFVVYFGLLLLFVRRTTTNIGQHARPQDNHRKPD